MRIAPNNGGDPKIITTTLPEESQALGMRLNGINAVTASTRAILGLGGFDFDLTTGFFGVVASDSLCFFSQFQFKNPLTAVSGRDDFQVAYIYFSVPPKVNVDVDVQPSANGEVGCLKINGKGKIPVAVYGRADFDVVTIDIGTLSLNALELSIKGNENHQCAYEDVNQDGLEDLVCHFVDDDDLWIDGDGVATLTGTLLDGTPIEGIDDICVVYE